jgi:hypothetical protein
MKFRAILMFALIVGFALTANAQKIPNDSGEQAIQPGNCPIEDYKGYCLPGVYIDCDSLLLGPMTVEDDGTTFTDVILQLNISQTWIGDLKVLLYYDPEGCDMQDMVGPVAAMCRPGLDGCPSDGCCGCSGDILGDYFFSDDGGLTPLGEFDCPSFLDPGCYMPAIESPNPFAVFDGQPKGGCFWLFFVDGACADGTDLFEWCVWTLNEVVVPVEETTWGQIKTIYE